MLAIQMALCRMHSVTVALSNAHLFHALCDHSERKSHTHHPPMGECIPKYSINSSSSS